jgi:hypothetical protein
VEKYDEIEALIDSAVKDGAKRVFIGKEQYREGDKAIEGVYILSCSVKKPDGELMIFYKLSEGKNVDAELKKMMALCEKTELDVCLGQTYEYKGSR